MESTLQWRGLLQRLVLCLVLVPWSDAGAFIQLYSEKEVRHEHKNAAYEVCDTPSCRKAAHHLLNSVNTSADPCQDFYEFSCGNWIQNHPIPPTESHRSTFEITTEKLHRRLRGILERPVSGEDLSPVRAAKHVYRVCMDLDLIALEGVDKLVKLSDSLGGWPMTRDEWSEEDFDTFSAMAEMEKLVGGGAYFSAGVACDRKNTSRKVITVDQPSMGLPRSMLSEPLTYRAQIAAYRTWIVETAHHMATAQNFRVPLKRIEHEARELVEFEIKLAKITTKSEMRRNGERLYNPMTLDDLQEWTDSAYAVNEHAQIDWLRYMRRLFSEVDTTVDSSERVIVREVDFLFKLVTLLDQTPRRVVANYLQWRFVKMLSPETTQEMRILAFDFEKVLIGVKEMLPRWRVCVLKVSSLLSYAVGYEYVKGYFDSGAKTSAQDMVGNIRQAFYKRMMAVDWMDEETKRVALDKADSMLEAIGYPDWFNNATAVEDYYNDVVVGDSHFTNMVHLQYISILRGLKKLRQQHDRSEWITSPEVVNAYYFPPTNTIIFPAGILQPPFFDKGRPESLNYGSIGMVIGHEITHGFDDVGRQSDKYGNIKQWWSKETLETYLKKSQCIIDQYSEFRLPELDQITNETVKMNGINTQGENIADSGGLNTAFLAYQKFLSKNGPECRLPGLTQFTDEQLFFVGFGAVWCESIHKEALLNTVLTDAHSPHRFRVMGSLANSEDFSRVFKCPRGSPMNPADKCKIW